MSTVPETNKGALAVAAAYRRRLSKRLAQPKQVNGQWPRLAVGMGLEVQLIWLTPEIATHWLAFAPQVQRPMNQRHIEMIERAIKDGDYKLNGETIVVNKDGHLANGQHRCQAVVSTGKKILTLVAYEVATDAFDTFDNTRVRTGASAMGARGQANGVTLEAAAKLIWRYEHNEALGSHKIKLSSREIDKIVLAHPELDKAVADSRACWKFCKSQSIPTFCYWAFAKVSAADCAKFFEKLTTGEGLVKGDPILELRRKISERVIRRDRDEWVLLIHWVFKSWNAWRKGEKINQLRIGEHEEMPKPI